MEQMEVKNKETTIPNQNEFNDKDMLTDVLSSLKSLSTLYGTCLQESSNDDLYQAIEDEANKVANMQRKVFYKLFGGVHNTLARRRAVTYSYHLFFLPI